MLGRTLTRRQHHSRQAPRARPSRDGVKDAVGAGPGRRTGERELRKPVGRLEPEIL